MLSRARSTIGVVLALWLQWGWPAAVLAQAQELLTRPASLKASEDQFLDQIEQRAFLYFWEAANPTNGLVKDRARADGQTDPRRVASIAATGFGLTALCIGAERHYTNHSLIVERARRTLEFLAHDFPHEHGFFYHFIDAESGQRVWKCELSTIDTALLLCGVLTVGQYFSEHGEMSRLASKIYERIDWRWMLTDDQLLSHGWKPETGFLTARWDEYCEHMLLYLLAIGAPSNAIPATAWKRWSRPEIKYEGLRYISPKAPLFIHQYSHAWFDFRDQRDGYADYFENSVIATKAHRLFCLNLSARYPLFGSNLWGITASDSARGYVAWGGPPEMGRLDGTIVPAAAAGSLPFLPVETLAVLRTLYEQYRDQVWKRYGFVDAFNPHNGWAAPDVIGIDVGISMLMAENLRTQLVWQTFMANPRVRGALKLVGFAPTCN